MSSGVSLTQSADNNDSGIVISAVTKTYKGGKVKALCDLSLNIHPGEIFGIIGPNGAGKTTLFGCLLALLKSDAGTIEIAGMPPDALKVKQVTGYLPERLTFDRWMSGLQFMSYHYELAKQPHVECKSSVAELLTLVGLDSSAWNVPIKKYSRGMLQRLGFAQALIGQPKYLLLDEPASGIDPSGVLLFRKLLKEQKSKGTTIVINSHQLEQLEKVCDRVAFIKSGSVQAIENLAAESATASRLRVVWKTADTPNTLLDETAIKAIVEPFGVQLIEFGLDHAVFAATNVDGIAATIKALVMNGFPVIRASSEESRLERYFTGTEESGQ